MVPESLTGLQDRKLPKKYKICSPVLDTVALNICGLFPKRHPSIWKRPGQKRWMQWSQSLTDSQILGVMSDEGRGLFRGCYWDSETRHAVLDIDQGSEYHNAECLAELAAEFSSVGLNLVPYQSSESGGWHLYLFFDSYVLSKEVESTIKDYLHFRRYEIKSGTLEIFPSGNALRLPLQKGFAWLTPSGAVEVAREELTDGQALALFFNDLETRQTNWQEAKSLIESQIGSAGSSAGIAGDAGVQEHKNAVSMEGLADLYSIGRDHEKYQRGREYWINGLTGPNQRHDGVCCVGQYLWFGDSSMGLRPLPYPSNAGARAELITAWLREKHNGHSEAVNSEQWALVEAQIKRACYWTAQGLQIRERESYPVTERMVTRLCQTKLTPDDFKKANRRREGAARAKIQRALAQCVDEGRKVTRNALARISGCSPNTVSKHTDLWNLLASRSGASITGGMGGVLGLPVLASSDDLGSGGSCLGPETAKELTDPSLVLGSSDLAVSDSLDSSVAPLLICLAESLPANSQHQDQASVAPSSQVLTLGPWLAGIRAEGQLCAGGISLLPSAWLIAPAVSGVATIHVNSSQLPSDNWLDSGTSHINTESMSKLFGNLSCLGLYRLKPSTGRLLDSVTRGPPA